MDTFTTPAADRLSRFISRHDRMPLLEGRSGERQLAKWVFEQQHALATGYLSEAAVIAFDTQLPGWSQPYTTRHDGTRNVIHHRRVLRCVDHFDLLGRYPTKTDRDEDVARLGEWLRQQRNASRGVGKSAITPSRIELLDRMIPGWDTTKSEVWLARARDVIGFVDERGHFPRPLIRDSEQTRMYMWLRHTREAVFGDRRGGARWQETYLDQHLPGWGSAGYIDPARLWYRYYRMTVQYLADRGGLPIGHVDSPEAARLSAWLHRSQRDETRARDERWALLDTNLPGWRTAKANSPYALTHAGRWKDALTLLQQFVTANGRLPGAHRTASPAERFLRAWMVRQRLTCDEDRAAQLDDVAPGWRDTTPRARPNTPIRGGLENTQWMAPRLGDVLRIGGQIALVIEPSLNPTAPVGVYGTKGTHAQPGTFDVVRLRWPASVRVAGIVRDATGSGQTRSSACADADALLASVH